MNGAAMNSLSRLTFGILLAATLNVGCGDSGGGTPGPDPSFMAVTPCSVESSYTTTGTTVTFPAAALDFNYSPKCLKVTAGSSVTFSGDFAAHPLDPSETRGTMTGNPIMLTNTGTSSSFTFPTAGFYAYYCQFHGADDGQYMDGVVWVK
jgi:plastocyanin